MLSQRKATMRSSGLKVPIVMREAARCPGPEERQRARAMLEATNAELKAKDCEMCPNGLKKRCGFGCIADSPTHEFSDRDVLQFARLRVLNVAGSFQPSSRAFMAWSSYGLKHLVEYDVGSEFGYCCNGVFILYMCAHGFDFVERGRDSLNVYFKIKPPFARA
jgi:hypothetical protein